MRRHCRDQVCYVFLQCCHLLRGVKQAFWLTKAKLIECLPEKNHIENQDERLLNLVSHACLWHCTEDIPRREACCPVIVDSLIQLCRFVPKIPHYLPPGIESLLQGHGSSGAHPECQRSSAPPISSREEVEATENHVLETFYPISPTADLQECNVYDVKNDTGFWEGYPYPISISCTSWREPVTTT
ncbi:39S ribosomal protein L37, mitochondrial [Plecturocebus cupreus]